MELGPYTLQIFVSLIVILGAALVALICDFLKGNNEQLRELTIELKVRREEEQKRMQIMLPQAAAVVGGLETAAIPVRTAAPQIKQRSETPRALAAPGETRRAPSSDAMAVMQRGAAMAGSPAQSRPAREAAATRQAAPARPAAKIEKTADPAIVSPAATVTAPPAGSRNWGAILGPKSPLSPAAQTVEPTASSEPGLPAGFQDGFVLSHLVKSRRPVSGLVVSIGVNAPREADGALPPSVRALVASLLGPADFASQSSADEFLLILPEEHGASAQRRLSQIAQQLWDFQLRSLGKTQILFSWGGVEVNSESIEEAIASASERMQETKRGRKILTMESRVA